MSAFTAAVEAKASWFRAQSDRDLLDSFLVAQRPAWEGTHFRSQGDYWREIARDEARALVDWLSTRSLAYRMKINPNEEGWCDPVAFLGAFMSGARYDTNVVDEQSWQPGADCTFDHGIGVVDDQHVGIYWVHDED